MNNKKNTIVAAAVAALSLITNNTVMAHGGSPNYIKIEDSLKSSGASFSTIKQQKKCILH